MGYRALSSGVASKGASIFSARASRGAEARMSPVAMNPRREILIGCEDEDVGAAVFSVTFDDDADAAVPASTRCIIGSDRRLRLVV